MALKDLDKVLSNLNKEIQKLGQTSEQGLIEAGALIRREGQKQTPVETSHLINSWYGPVTNKTTKGVICTIGLMAEYAPFVHEMVGADFHSPRKYAKSQARRKGGKSTAKAKFLEDPLKENAGKVLEIIAEKSKIG